LRRGEPHSWDELAATLNGEEEMAKKSKDGENPDLLRLVEILEEHFDDGEEAQDQTPETRALKHLRAIKPVIQATGDRKAIDAYNDAVRALKQQTRTVLAADSRSGRATADDEEYARSMKKFHRKGARDVESTADSHDEKTTAYDADVDVAADYEKRVRATRERMLRGQK